MLNEINITLDRSQAWFSCKGAPVGLQLPIGLIYDMLIESQDEILILDLHLNDFPVDRAVNVGTLSAIFDYFINILKEADFIRHGSIQKVMGISLADQTKLWNAIDNDDFDTYTQIMNQVVNLDNESDVLKSLPIRLYSHSGAMIRKLFPIQGTVSGLLKELHLEPKCVRLHGIDLDLNTPLLWLAKNSSFQDTFLHILLIY